MSDEDFQDERYSSDDAERQELDCLEVSTRTSDACHILDILDGSSKRPIKFTESDKNGRTIVKNQKDIDHWNGHDGWAMSVLSTSVEPVLIKEHVTATSSHELSKLKAIHEPKTEVSQQVL